MLQALLLTLAAATAAPAYTPLPTLFARVRVSADGEIIAAEFRNQFPTPVKLWTVTDLGSWGSVDPQLFDRRTGAITKVYLEATG